MAIQETSTQAVGDTNVLLGRIISSIRRGLSIILSTTSGRIGFGIVLVHLVVALIGTWLAPYTPTEFHLDDRLASPSTTFLLGTDQFGRDVLSRVLAGARSIIWISVVGTFVGITLGTIVGTTSGYLGGKLDQLIMRIVDWFLAFPALLLALLIISMGTKRFHISESWLIILTIGIAFMPNSSRVIRSAALAIKPLEFVQAARLRGEPTLYIIFREILPNLIPVVAVEATIRLSFALLLTASLGFLGLGVQPPTSDWGLMVSEGRDFLSIAPWGAIAPALAMASLIVGINMLSDGIREGQQLPSSEVEP
jgi:peptide/nickel transport system permease protein